MGERDALLATIMANPHDTTPRFILADWLDENGDTSNLAELIRTQAQPVAGRWYPSNVIDHYESSPCFRRRSFVERVEAMAWLKWLRVQEYCYWRPGKFTTVEAPCMKCNGKKGYEAANKDRRWYSCLACKGYEGRSTGTHEQSVFLTAQPITEVVLFDDPVEGSALLRNGKQAIVSVRGNIEIDVDKEARTFTAKQWWPTVTFFLPPPREAVRPLDLSELAALVSRV